MLHQTGQAILNGARRTPDGKPFVARQALIRKVVNRSAPDLFPAACMLKNSFIPREKWSAAAP
jgi:hypothetical protein